ncbi:hypothetical protein BDA96_10G333900 [Sorghum bicolor]|jgi:hypothetical protein|uniref:Uncharacterized protein n=2 Tax=Sorghum bicolor TaxID=4558 RepID=A0A921Q5S1_SORBI|nr:uncharacterized protein LOC110430725 [Sorghum bicolor]KAG0516104.1 hypothetical protein BDA96_10G333900 [Sorghum bicolor]KXG20831.1 hypothetical protein SORBI_3010G258900 [Sorghum bicolor]|eukprot:XP_021304258.1 uncharacterized protein LOC110430725 [Sorghum bicolor]
MASLGKLVLVAGLAFLVLASQDQGHGGPAGGGGPAIGAAAAAAPPAPEVLITTQLPQPLSAAVAVSKRVLIPIPTSGPSNKRNSEVNHEKPSAAAQSGGRRRTRAMDGGRRLGSP